MCALFVCASAAKRKVLNGRGDVGWCGAKEVGEGFKSSWVRDADGAKEVVLAPDAPVAAHERTCVKVPLPVEEEIDDVVVQLYWKPRARIHGR